MDYSKCLMFTSEVIKTCADNKWIKIESFDMHRGRGHDWIKATSIPDYQKLKAGDYIDYSFIRDDKPVTYNQRGNIVNISSCDVSIY